MIIFMKHDAVWFVMAGEMPFAIFASHMEDPEIKRYSKCAVCIRKNLGAQCEHPDVPDG